MRREWPTWVALLLVYVAYAFATTWLASWSLLLAIALTGIAAAFHSSLSHEALHGHPTRNAVINAALVFPALSLFIPYLRFKDTHLAHHIDERLTDPYDDPESNFQDPDVWARLTRVWRLVLRLNNTLAGRMILGPFVSQLMFVRTDFQAIRSGDHRVRLGWLLHIPSVALVIWWAVTYAEMSVWAVVLSAYLGLSLLKIRTYLEHRAHMDAPARIVLIEDRGPLSYLFLNNNYHIVHHSHPRLAWSLIPAEYRAHRAEYQALNDGYFYASYAPIFRKYFWRAKDPVPHPLWSKR